MRRFLKLTGGLGLVLVLGMGVASAQLNEPLLANLDFLPGTANTAPSPFTCLDGTECNIYQRMYPDLDPTKLNDSSIVGNTLANDGHPTFDIPTSQWRGDDYFTGNYAGVTANVDACEAWHSVWVAVNGPGTPLYRSYYGANSTIVNHAEIGQRDSPTCGPGTAQGACFGQNDRALSNYPNTPGGAIGPQGLGWEPVPIPEVTNSNLLARTVNLSWKAAANALSVNNPSVTSTPCPSGLSDPNDPGSPVVVTSSFDDNLPTEVVPSAIWAVRLFVYKTVAGAARSLDSLEAGTIDANGKLSVLTRGASQNIGCANNTSNCPGVKRVNCNRAGVTGGACMGALYSPAAQNITITEAAVNGALAANLSGIPPLGPGESVVFVTKVVFRGGVNNSLAHNARIPNKTNPQLLSLFSTNSTKVSFAGLVASAAITSSAVSQRGIDLTVHTIGDVLSLSVARSLNGIEFETFAEFPTVPGQDTYTVSDDLTRTRTRGRLPAQLTYRLTFETSTGPQITFTTVDTNPDPGRGRGRGRNRGRRP